MATTAYNNIVRGGAQGRSLFPSALPVLSSSVTYNQGDLLCFNASSHILAVAATGNVANFLGVAVNTVVNGLPQSPYPGVPVTEAVSDLAGPLYSVVASLILETGSTLNPGDLVYLSAVDAQHVADSDPGSNGSIGIYMGAQGALSSSTAGQKIDVLVGARFGMSGLTF